jgi:peptide/nickel transport system substrate-binding protein
VTITDRKIIVAEHKKNLGREIMKLVPNVIAVAAAAVVLAAVIATPAPSFAEPVRLGTDVDAQTLDPRVMRNTTAYRTANMIYDGLVELDGDLRPVPGLALRWENPEPTIWIFYLRDGVKFHNGSDFSADDVVYTFETILDPDLKSRWRSLYTPIIKIEAIDRLTVRIELSEPYAPLLSYFDMGIVSKAYVEGGGDIAAKPIGTGPMKLASWARGSKIELEPNMDYWGGAPTSDGFTFVIVADNTSRAAAFEAGDLDIIQSPLSPQDILRLAKKDDIGKSIVGALGVTYLNFNNAAEHMGDPAMRRALSMLIDQDAIVNGIYEGVDEIATSILLPSHFPYTESIRQPSFDPAGAKKALADLGWTDSDGDGVLDKDGKALMIEIATHSEDPNRIQAVEFIQATFKANGVGATVAISDWPAFFQSVQNGTHQIALLGWLNLVDPDRLMFGQLSTGGGLNWGKYSNTNVDKYLSEGRSSTELNQRIGAYRNAAVIISEEVPYYVISYQGYQMFHNKDIVLRPDVRGMMRSAVGF